MTFSIGDLAMSLVILSLLSRVVLTLVTDEAVSRLVTPAALIAGQRLRHVEVSVGQVSLKGPCSRERFLTEAAVSTAPGAMMNGEVVLVFHVSLTDVPQFRDRPKARLVLPAGRVSAVRVGERATRFSVDMSKFSLLASVTIVVLVVIRRRPIVRFSVDRSDRDVAEIVIGIGEQTRLQDVDDVGPRRHRLGLQRYLHLTVDIVEQVNYRQIRFFTTIVRTTRIVVGRRSVVIVIGTTRSCGRGGSNAGTLVPLVRRLVVVIDVSIVPLIIVPMARGAGSGRPPTPVLLGDLPVCNQRGWGG